jgi:hypothetical protein
VDPRLDYQPFSGYGDEATRGSAVTGNLKRAEVQRATEELSLSPNRRGFFHTNGHLRLREAINLLRQASEKSDESPAETHATKHRSGIRSYIIFNHDPPWSRQYLTTLPWAKSHHHFTLFAYDVGHYAQAVHSFCFFWAPLRPAR